MVGFNRKFRMGQARQEAIAVSILPAHSLTKCGVILIKTLILLMRQTLLPPTSYISNSMKYFLSRINASYFENEWSKHT
ncbi:MAG: hypothetical protein WCQ26_07815 [Pseudanabaena sp. ELA748]